MDAIQGVVTNLLDDETLASLIDDRVFFRHAPKDAAFPLVNVSPVSEAPFMTLGGEVSNQTRTRVQVDIWANTYSEIVPLTTAVIASINAEETNFKSVRLDKRYEDDNPNGLERVILDFAIWT